MCITKSLQKSLQNYRIRGHLQAKRGFIQRNLSLFLKGTALWPSGSKWDSVTLRFFMFQMTWDWSWLGWLWRSRSLLPCTNANKPRSLLNLRQGRKPEQWYKGAHFCKLPYFLPLGWMCAVNGCTDVSALHRIFKYEVTYTLPIVAKMAVRNTQLGTM